MLPATGVGAADIGITRALAGIATAKTTSNAISTRTTDLSMHTG